MYVNGDKVYYIHQGDTKWRGPAIVLGQDGQQILLKHGSFYVHTHCCHVQHVNPTSDKPLEPQAISTPKTTSPLVKDQHVAPNLTASSDSEDEGETLDEQKKCHSPLLVTPVLCLIHQQLLGSLIHRAALHSNISACKSPGI